MKRLLLAWGLFASSVGCGPSAEQIRVAQAASYQGSPDELYDIALQVAAEDYKIGDNQPGKWRFATVPQWYSPEGGRQSAGAGNFVQLDDRSVQLTLIVEVVVQPSNQMNVVITPVTLQYITGSPQPRELKPEDPNLPPWIHGRVESLQLAIYEKAKPMVASQ